jgi:hypothetical protein
MARVIDTTSNHNFVLYAVDCATNSITDSIEVGRSNSGSECGAYDWRTHKFYTRGGPDCENLVVIDVATDSVLRRLPLPCSIATRQCLAYNGTSGRLYVAANDRGGSVGVLDCATDSFVKWIPDAGVACLTWDSLGNKLYSTIGDWGVDALKVIDCATDSVVDTVANCPDGYYATAYSRRNRLYTCGDFGDIGIVDTQADTVVFRVPVQVSLNECVVCNEHEDKVYAGARSNSSSAYDSVYVLDCLGDTVLHRRVGLDGSAYIDWVALAPWSNRLYCGTSQGRLFAVDCSTDSVVGVADPPRVGSGCDYFVCHPDNHRVYATRYWDSCVYVYRDEPNPIAEQTAPPQTPRLTFSVTPNPTRGTIRAVLPSSLPPSTLSVFDCYGSLVRSFVIGHSSFDIADLASGVYILRLTSASGQTASTRVTLLH